MERGTTVSVESLCLGFPAPPAAGSAARRPSGLLEAERRHVLGVLEAEQLDIDRAAAALEVSREELGALIAKHGLKRSS